MNMKKFLLLIWCVALFAACAQEENSIDIGSRSTIAFNTKSVVRSAISQDDIDNKRATVKVYATKNGSAL